MRLVAFTLLLLGWLWVVPAAAGAAEPSVQVVILADLPDGDARVGIPAHFQYLLIGADGTPFTRHDMRVTVETNGIVLYRTSALHEYDGVGGLQVTFPAPGRYEVLVELKTEEGLVQAVYAGRVLPLGETVEARPTFEGAGEAVLGDLVPFVFALVDAAGEVIPHVDALVEIRGEDHTPVLQFHAHGHRAPMAFQFAFEKGGEHRLRIVAYPAVAEAGHKSFKPVIIEHTIDVLGASGVRADATRTSMGPPIEPPTAPRAETGNESTDEGIETFIVGDPISTTNGIAGPYTQVRMSAVTSDATTGELVPGVDHEAILNGPLGTVFSSNSLHEEDGVLEVMVLRESAGAYTWTVDAVHGRAQRATLQYRVEAPEVSMTAGPRLTRVQGLSGVETVTAEEYTVDVRDVAGRDARHAEIDLQLLDPRGVPLFTHKLHAHNTGGFAYTYTFARGGSHVLHVDPFVLDRTLVPIHYGPQLGDDRLFMLQVASGEVDFPVGDYAADATAPTEVNDAPGATLGTLMVAGLLLLRRRRA